MDKLRQSSHGRIPCVTVAAVGMLLPASFAVANPVTVPVQVTFVEPIAISEVSALEFGSVDQSSPAWHMMHSGSNTLA